MTKFYSEPLSRNVLRAEASKLRRLLGFTNSMRVPVVELLDKFGELFSGFSYEIVPDSCMPADIHAETDVASGHVKIKESIYERACQGYGRDRMTIAHELAHYYLTKVIGYKLYENKGHSTVKTCQDPEWQAKCFAGEFMIGFRLVKGMTSFEIASRCGVSEKAASFQLSRIS
ncbi:MAG: ImmA/IrrE family metallo-endopeptidase [bacterium]|nr:ImmA/IrrE family metallo-endopeptidase [bacterium]